MTSKIVVNNIEADAGVSTVTFNSNIERGSSNLHSTGLALGAGSTVGAVTGVTTYYGDGSQLTGIDLGSVTGATGDFSIADKIVHTGDTNTAIRFPAADTITAETSGSERLRIDSSGRLLAGAGAIANPKSSGAGSIDLDNQAFSIIVGGNHPSGGRSDNNAKTFRMSMVHNTLAEEPINILQGYCDSSDNNLYIGGGTGSANSLTSVRIYTGANTTTTGGTERFRIHSAGQIGLGGANYGSAGQFLKSQGSGSAAVWGDAGGLTTEIYAYVSFGTTYDPNSGYVTQDVSSLQSGSGITVDNSNSGERLTPTVAGKYFVMYMCNWLWSFSGGATFYNRITKNGSEQQRSTFSKYDPGSHTNITMCVMTLNGSSDYVQFQGYENKSGQAAYMGNLSRAVMFKLRD